MYLLQCSKCRDWLCPNDFYPDTTRKRGRGTYCRPCCARLYAEKRHTNTSQRLAAGIDIDTLGEQYCSQCATWKPADAMTRNASTRTGITGTCKACHLLATHKIATVNKAKHAAVGINLSILGPQWCRMCHEHHPAQDMTQDPRTRTGLARICKSCNALATRRRSLANKAKHAADGIDVDTLDPQWCRGCNTWKSARDMPMHSETKTGLRNICKACNATQGRTYRFHTRAERARYHRAWAQNHPEQCHAYAAARRALKKNAPQVERIVRTIVFARDKWICQLCFKKTNPAMKYPHPDCPTIDHVIPLANGGSHTYPNVVCAHASCNSSKKNRPVTQQMRLF